MDGLFVKRLIVIYLAILLVAAGGITAYWYFTRPSPPSTSGTGTNTTQQALPLTEDNKAQVIGTLSATTSQLAPKQEQAALDSLSTPPPKSSTSAGSKSNADILKSLQAP